MLREAADALPTGKERDRLLVAVQAIGAVACTGSAPRSRRIIAAANCHRTAEYRTKSDGKARDRCCQLISR